MDPSGYPSGFPTVTRDALSWLIVGQTIEADRLAVEEVGIGLLQWMEHAGSSPDLPSGHGSPGPVAPEATLPLAIPERAVHGSVPLYLADLGLPPSLWISVGVEVAALFSPYRILQVV